MVGLRVVLCIRMAGTPSAVSSRASIFLCFGKDTAVPIQAPDHIWIATHDVFGPQIVAQESRRGV